MAGTRFSLLNFRFSWQPGACCGNLASCQGAVPMLQRFGATACAGPLIGTGT